MCNGDNEADAMEQEWALKQARKEREFQDGYERWLMEQMDLKSHEIVVQNGGKCIAY